MFHELLSVYKNFTWPLESSRTL